MALNPEAAVFVPAVRAVGAGSGANELSKPQTHEPAAEAQTSRQRRAAKYRQRLENHRHGLHAKMHSIIRDYYNAAYLQFGQEGVLSTANVHLKLVVDLVKLLAGLGWSTGTVLRAVALLELDRQRDARECLEDARALGEEYHQRKAFEAECIMDMEEADEQGYDRHAAVESTQE